MSKKGKHRKPINHKGMAIDPKRMARKTPPINWADIPLSTCQAIIGRWPCRKVCGHKFFHPLCNIQIVPGSQPVMFGLTASPFVVCSSCGADPRPQVDIKQSQFWEWLRYSLLRRQADKIK